MQIKVAIVDDDEGIRASLAVLIRRAPNLKLTGDYANAETALKEVPRHPPDVVLMDINLPGMKGVECVRQLKATMPAVQFLMLTVYETAIPCSTPSRRVRAGICSNARPRRDCWKPSATFTLAARP